MLWALLRLSVRDAAAQLRYRRLLRLDASSDAAAARTGPIPGMPDARRPGETPGPPAYRDCDFLDQKSMSPPPPGMAGAFSFSGFSAITASVVRNRPAIEAAFCSADRVTFAGSMMPALNMSTYSPSAAFRP